MKHLLDTDVIIDHIRGTKKLEHVVVSDAVAISVISYGELLYGAEKSAHPEKARQVVASFLDLVCVTVIPLDEPIMKEYARLKRMLETKGDRLDDFDLLIAATAISRGYGLVTRNKKHFKRIKDLLLV